MKKLKVILSLVIVFTISLLSSGIVGASSDSLVIFNDVNNPKTVEQFKYEIGATDVQDGDISNNIYIIIDNYTGNETTLGDFVVVYGVTDTLGAEASFAATVRNVDVGRPEIIVVVESTLKIPQYSNLESNLPNIKAIDPYEGDITSAMVIQGLDEIDTSINGSYDLTYSVSDSSGNTVSKSVTVHVVDAVIPVIDGPSKIIKRSDTILDGQFFMEYFSSYDDQDGVITDRLQIVSDTYLGNASNEGTYKVIISATDDQGNEKIHTLTIEVVSNMIPKLIIDKYHWVVSNDHQITNDEFVNILQGIEDLPNYTYLFTNQSDTYTDSYDSYDSFQKSFNLLSNSGIEFDRRITLEVTETNENIIIANPNLQTTIFDSVMSVVPWLLGIGVALYFWKHMKKKRGYN